MSSIAKMQALWQEMMSWMTKYMKSFYAPEDVAMAKSHLNLSVDKPIFFDDAELVDGLVIKEIHTWKVTNNCQKLAHHLQLKEHDVILAQMIGLFHDIGRFTQFVKYRTFNDALSENHAQLGLKILAEVPLLQRLDPEDLAVLKFAIANHNARTIAPTDNPRYRAFARLIRDADKVDIYRVLKPYLGPTDGTGCSPDFVEQFIRQEQCDYTKMRTQDDRKIVRLMWVYDINYRWSLQQLIEANYIEDIIANMVQDERMQLGFERLRQYIDTKLSQPDIWEG